MNVENFYDNVPPSSVEGTELVQVERIYCISFDEFTEESWQDLAGIYRELPNYCESSDLARWYGTNEASPPFLWASVEPSGLQVAGMLALADWHDWDSKFRKLGIRLPLFEV